jgi:flagellar hook protein FlgE
MLNSLTSGVSGLMQFQGRLDVIGNNLANSNTVAYKSARTDFADTFSQTLQAPGNNTSSKQIGTGVGTAAIKNLFGQGSIATTDVESDLFISGEGFFMVKDTVSGKEFATRAGDFRLDESGYLVTNTGLRVQGFSDAALTTRNDIQIDGAGRPATSNPAATVGSYSIDDLGKVNVNLTDGTTYVRGQVLLQRFQDPQALLKEGNNLYSGISFAGPLGGATPQIEAPGTNGLGRIKAGALESSNVDIATEFANLITTQRGFQASARIITTSDEVLQELVNLKR